MVNGESLLQFIRLLGELNACGLTEDQYEFIGESSDLTELEVNLILEKADEAYEALKNLMAQGHKILCEPMSKEEGRKFVEQHPDDPNPLLRAIVFPTPEQLQEASDIESRNDLITEQVIGSDYGLGAYHGLYYSPLLESIPYVVEADVVEDAFGTEFGVYF